MTVTRHPHLILWTQEECFDFWGPTEFEINSRNGCPRVRYVVLTRAPTWSGWANSKLLILWGTEPHKGPSLGIATCKAVSAHKAHSASHLLHHTTAMCGSHVCPQTSLYNFHAHWHSLLWFLPKKIWFPFKVPPQKPLLLIPLNCSLIIKLVLNDFLNTLYVCIHVSLSNNRVKSIQNLRFFSNYTT